MDDDLPSDVEAKEEVASNSGRDALNDEMVKSQEEKSRDALAKERLLNQQAKARVLDYAEAHRQHDMAIAAQSHLATGGMFSSNQHSPEVALRIHCLQAAIGTCHGQPVQKITEYAQAFYDFMIGAKPSASLHVVKP